MNSKNFLLLVFFSGIIISPILHSQTIYTKLTDTFWEVDEDNKIAVKDGLNKASMWHKKTNLPFQRYYAGGFSDGTNLVISGGDITGGGVGTNDVTTYNIETNIYGSLQDLPTDLRLHASFKYKDSYRFLGGYQNNNSLALDVHIKYDLGTQLYSNSTPLPEGTFYGRALSTSDDDGFYFIGGSNDASDILNKVYYFREATLLFEEATPLPKGRADGGAAWLDDNTIGYFGGFSPSFDSPLQVDSIFIGVINPSDPLDITWSAGESFPGGPRARFHAYNWGPNQVIVVGGSDNENFPAFSDAWVYTYSGDGSGSWQQVEDKPTPMTAYQGGSFNVGNDIMKLVIAGGITTGPALSAIVEVYTDTIPGSTSVEIVDETIPSGFQLSQNYPNPFNPSTTIQFSIPEEGFVSLDVFNSLGEKVSTLVTESLNAGTYKYDWNAEELTSGIYFYRLRTEGFVETKKMILLK